MALIGYQSGTDAVAVLEMCGIIRAAAGSSRSTAKDVWDHERRRGAIPRDRQGYAGS
jgi:hypothetical protein